MTVWLVLFSLLSRDTGCASVSWIATLTSHSCSRNSLDKEPLLILWACCGYFVRWLCYGNVRNNGHQFNWCNWSAVTLMKSYSARQLCTNSQNRHKHLYLNPSIWVRRCPCISFAVFDIKWMINLSSVS